MNLFLLISALVTLNLCAAEENSRITGIREYPWLVLIEYPRIDKVVLSCGGVLISDRYVLTAAHCVVGKYPQSNPPRNVRLGEFDTSNEVGQQDCVTSIGGDDCTEGAVVIPIEKIIPHPDYDSNDKIALKHDIALVKISTAAPYSEFIRPISLPTTDLTSSPPSDWQLIEAGWGGKALNDTWTKKMDLKLPFVPLSECQSGISTFNRKIDLWQGHMCAGGKEGKVSCNADGGGPLMWENPNGNKVFEVVGIASIGPIPCSPRNIPTVYTKVHEYNSWIHDNIKA